MNVVMKSDGFFIDEIEAAEKKLQITLSPHTKLYILYLLKRLSENRDFFYSEVIQDKPLGVVLMEAVHKDVFEKARDLKAVGDVSLIFSGLYPEALTRRTVDIDYFIQIGQRSYSILSDTYSPYRTKQELKTLYSLLVSEFVTLIELLTEISEDLNFIQVEDIPRILRRWKKTRIRKYRNIMDRRGIVPIEPEPDW